MNSDTGMTKGKYTSDYRIKPTLPMALIVVVIYTIYVYTAESLSGVPYTDIGESVENLTSLVLIPIGGGALLLVLFAITMILGIVANFSSGNFFSNPVALLLVGAVSMACVGFSEEILFRGIVLRGARGSGFSESNYIPDPVGSRPEVYQCQTGWSLRSIRSKQCLPW